MGSPMRVFRLVRATGAAGCEHHALPRAGRPSYPNADQGAEDAACAFPDVLMGALAAWCVLLLAEGSGHGDLRDVGRAARAGTAGLS